MMDKNIISKCNPLNGVVRLDSIMLQFLINIQFFFSIIHLVKNYKITESL